MPDGEAKSNAEIRDRFRKQIDKLVETGKGIDKAARLAGQREWTQIDLNEWDGDLNNVDDMGKPFDREEIAQDYKDAVKDAESPGTVGDLMASQLQGDFLACQERAFKRRHSSSVRAIMHAAARRKGHSDSAGVLSRGVLGYLEDLLKSSKDTA